MTTEEFLRDVCPNHTDNSKWNKSELLHILELHSEQLRKHAVVGRSEQLVCDACGKDKVEGLDHCECYEGTEWVEKAN